MASKPTQGNEKERKIKTHFIRFSSESKYSLRQVTHTSLPYGRCLTQQSCTTHRDQLPPKKHRRRISTDQAKQPSERLHLTTNFPHKRRLSGKRCQTCPSLLAHVKGPLSPEYRGPLEARRTEGRAGAGGWWWVLWQSDGTV